DAARNDAIRAIRFIGPPGQKARRFSRMARRWVSVKEADLRGDATLYSGLLDRRGIQRRGRGSGLQKQGDGRRHLRSPELRIAAKAELRRLDHQRDEGVVVPGRPMIGAFAAALQRPEWPEDEEDMPAAAGKVRVADEGLRPVDLARRDRLPDPGLPPQDVESDLDRPRRKRR